MRKFLILLFGLLLLICSGSCNLYPLYLKHFMEKFNLTIRQLNIYGTCINIGLWVAFPTGIFYDKYGPKLSLVFGLILLPGSYLIIHFLINSSSILPNLPFFFLALLALLLGQGSAILHTTAFSLNLNNFKLKDSSLLVSMLSLNMSIGPSLLAFFKENISYFSFQNYYIFLSLFLATIIFICIFLFKDYSDDKNELDGKTNHLKIDNEIFLIKKIYSCNIFICVSYIITLILNYAGFIYIKRIMVIVIPIMILLQFVYFFFNYKQIKNNLLLHSRVGNIKVIELNNNSLQSKEIYDRNEKLKNDDNIKDLGLINLEVTIFEENNKNKQSENNKNFIISEGNKDQNVNFLKSEVNIDFSNEFLSNNNIENNNNLVIEKKNNNYYFLYLLFCILLFGIGSLISNYNNIHFLIDSLHNLNNSSQNSQKNITHTRNMRSEDKTKILMFDNLLKNVTFNITKFEINLTNYHSLKEIEEALINNDEFYKKKIFFYLIVYFTCNGITRLFSNSVLQCLIRKDKMFYHLLLASFLGLLSQFLGMLMKKVFLFYVISLCGICHGMYMTFVPIFVKKFFNHKDFGKIMGFLTTGSAIGSLINSNFLFIHFYEKYGFYLNKESNYKICRETYCFSYGYLFNMLFFSINILISILFIIQRKKLILIL